MEGCLVDINQGGVCRDQFAKSACKRKSLVFKGVTLRKSILVALFATLVLDVVEAVKTSERGN